LRYLLDTNVLVDFLRGRFPAVARRIRESAPEDLVTSSVVAAELRYGAEKSARPEENHARLDVLLREIRSLPFDEAAASAYGTVRASLERRDKPIGANDLLIGAQALACGLILVTDNTRELARIEGLVVETWRR